MRIVLLGEQATGKSSFLVALYGALVNRRAGDMRIVRTVDDVEFLSRGLQALGRRESVRRTEVDGQARLLIDVAHNDSIVSIELPERSGELVRHMIEARQWEDELRLQLTGAAGAILCIRSDYVHAAQPDPGPLPAQALPPAWSPGLMPPAHGPADAAATPLPAWSPGLMPPAHGPADAAATLPPAWSPGLMPPAHGPADPAATPPPAWSPGLMPPDARAVDLLQAVLEDRGTALPLAVVISAWDQARVPMAPDAWLSEYVPLLDQFLATHAGQLPHRTFGVSAQGADFYENGGQRGVDEDPWDRAYVVGPEGGRGTIADPIAWLIETAM